jgi:hypothetical protein
MIGLMKTFLKAVNTSFSSSIDTSFLPELLSTVLNNFENLFRYLLASPYFCVVDEAHQNDLV